MKLINNKQHICKCYEWLSKHNIPLEEYNLPANSTWNYSSYFIHLYEVLSNNLDDYGFRTYARYCTEEQLSILVTASYQIPNIWRITDWSKVPVVQLENYINYLYAGFTDNQLLRSTLSLVPHKFYKLYEQLQNPSKADLVRKYGLEFTELIPVLHDYEVHSVPRDVYESTLFINTPTFHHANRVYYNRTGEVITQDELLLSNVIFNDENILSFFLRKQLGDGKFNELLNQPFQWNSFNRYRLLDILSAHGKQDSLGLFSTLRTHKLLVSIIECLYYSKEILTYLTLNMSESDIFEISKQLLKDYKRKRLKPQFTPLIESSK